MSSPTPSRPDEDLVLPRLLKRRSESAAGRVFLAAVDGDSLTYEEVYRRAVMWAHGLRSLGVSPGDRVVSMFQPSIDGVVAWLAVSLTGGINVPLNTLYFGNVLQHALTVVEPTVVLTSREFVARFDEVGLDRKITRVVRAGDAALPLSPAMVDLADFDRLSTDDSGLPGLDSKWGDLAALLFTSGTTGPSKACKVTWLQLYCAATYSVPEPEPDDRFYSPWPLNHISGVTPVYLMASVGGRVVLRPSWSTSAFMKEVFDHGCTSVALMLEMVAAVNAMELPEGAEKTPLRKVFVAPTAPYLDTMMAKLGARYCTWYGSTETSGPIASGSYNPVPTGSCGRRREGVDLRLVDQDGNDVGPGEIGELWVRAHDPLEMNQGYWGMPEATARAWEGDWYKTGDLMRVDDDGYYYFESRGSDRIRHRGENVSAWEVKLAIEQFKGVQQAAVVGIPAGDRDDEIHACVVIDPDVDLERLREHCQRSLPKFMWPSRYHVMPSLPMTPTGKIQNAVLRDQLIKEGASGR